MENEMSESEYTLTTFLEAAPPFMPDPANIRMVRVGLPPGDPGAPPHWHPGPNFGYVIRPRQGGPAGETSSS
jgi:hypothetical protein